MPKVLLISQLNSGGLLDVPMVLRALGIDCDVMIATSNTSYSALHPIAGVTGAINPTSTDFRNLMRQYQAVFVNVYLPADTTDTRFDPTINTWMASWNAPQDPPVFHFAQVINTRATLNLPSDFPIIRANTNDIPNTMWRWHPESLGPPAIYRRIGTRVKFLREEVSAYTRAYNFFWANETEGAAYLVDTLLLGAGNSELLIVPDFPDQNRMPATPPFTSPAFGVRYRNHYFLPGLNYYNWGRRGSAFTEIREAGGVSWILYALKLAGIRPARKIPIVMEFDHPVEPMPFARDNYGWSFPNQVRGQRITYEWLIGFCRPRGIQIVLGSRTGSRYVPTADPHFWRQCHASGDSYWGTGGTTQGREEANRIRAILRDNPDVFAFGVHDHTIPTDSAGGFNNTRWDRNGITLTRHSDAGYRYAAPNPIPTRHGTVINRKVAPASYQPNNTTIFEFVKNGVRYLDIDPPTTTAATANFQDGCIWTAKMLLERALAEHTDLEIPTIHGYIGYTNHARNWHGGEGYWEAFREFGFRGFRVTGDSVGRRHGHPCGHPYRMRYRELDFVPGAGMDVCLGGVGFYHSAATYSHTLFGLWALEPTSGANAYELRGPNNEWMTSSEWRAIRGVWAIRRYLAWAMDMWLWSACVMNGTAYIHPGEICWIDPNNPLGEPFTGTAGSQTYTGVFNFIKELFLAMDELVQVLGDYIKWGTVRELMDFRAAVGL